MTNDWITTTEASKLSGYHPDHIRRLIRGGRINGQKFGFVWQVSKSSVLDYISYQEHIGKRRGPQLENTNT